MEHDLRKVTFEIGSRSGFRAGCTCGWTTGVHETPGQARRAWGSHGAGAASVLVDADSPNGARLRRW